jgi:hypothetical protein
MHSRTDQEMNRIEHDPMVFFPPRLKRALQLAVGLPLSLVVVLSTFFFVWLMWSPHVVELRVDGGRLHVTTAPDLFSRHHDFDLATVVAVEEVHLGRGSRIAGTAMPGYCVGRFSYDNLGGVWQATDCSRDVVVLRRANDISIVLTPPDRDRFRAALVTGGGYQASQEQPKTGRGWILVKLLVLMAPLAALVVPAVFLFAPNRLRYRVISGGLEVTTILGVRRFVTAGCTARRHRPRVGIRLWGTGAPGYYTGTFRVDGSNAKLYTTSVKEGVLIEGPGLRVFVNPENETGFLQAMHTTGGATE